MEEKVGDDSFAFIVVIDNGTIMRVEKTKPLPDEKTISGG